MKKYLSVLLLTGIVATVSAQDSKEPYMVKSLASESIEHVKCETSGGNISIAGAD